MIQTNEKHKQEIRQVFTRPDGSFDKEKMELFFWKNLHLWKETPWWQYDRVAPESEESWQMVLMWLEWHTQFYEPVMLWEATRYKNDETF
jgi:hypothetical protein